MKIILKNDIIKEHQIKFTDKVLYDMGHTNIQNLNILLTPTESCNMKCKYCFDKQAQYTFKKHKLLNYLTIEDLEDIFNKVAVSTKRQNVTLHGGEQLLWGKENIEQQLKLQQQYKNIKIDSIQTNQTLLTTEIMKMLYNNNVGVSTSFDFINNDKSRGFTDKIVKGIKLIQQIQGKVGVIQVVNKYNYKQLVDSYIMQNEMNIAHISFNIVQQPFTSKYGIKYKNQEKSFKKYFLYYITHNNIRERYITDTINKLVNPAADGLCNMSGDCIVRWVGIFPNKDVANGDFYYPKHEYIYGNLNNADKLSDMFKTQNFINYQKAMAERKKSCIEKNCPVYPYCKSGCNWRHYLYAKDISKQSPNYCIMTLSYIKWLLETIKNIKKNKQEIKNKNIGDKITYIITNFDKYEKLIDDIDKFIDNNYKNFITQIKEM